MLATRFQVIDDAPDQSVCKNCNSSCPLVWYARRSAIDITSAGQALLDIKIGVYRCNSCQNYFRNNLNYILPKALFTNRVVNVAVASVIEDSMPVSKVVRRLERDFGLKVSESAIRKWVTRAAQVIGDQKEKLEPQVISETSGVLCIDEAYSGALGILLATNPNQKDELVGYLVSHDSFDSEDVEKFHLKLKENGIEPDQVVTDESALYPEVIKTVWPKTRHQLCLFHMSQKLVNIAKKAVRDIRKSIPKPPRKDSQQVTKKTRELVEKVLDLHSSGVASRKLARDFSISRNTIKKWLSDPDKFLRKYRSSPKNDIVSTKRLNKGEQSETHSAELVAEGWESWDQIKDIREVLIKLAFDISSNKGYGSDEIQKRYQQVLGSPLAPKIVEIRNFVESWYSIWTLDEEALPNLETAQRSWEELADRKLLFVEHHFGKFQSRMTNRLFDSLSFYFQREDFQSTNNSAERYARVVKKIQKASYRIRSKHHLADRVLLQELMRRKRIQNEDLYLSNPCQI
nr:transposase [Pseudobacteriovorax antillogorgiicola]